MKYFRMISPDTGDNIMMKRTSHREIHTTSGHPIDTVNLELPFELDIYVNSDYGYDQYDPFFTGEVKTKTLEERLHDYYSLPCTMTPNLVDSILSAGVENLQVFPTHIQ